ncbi:hypothetical protein DFH27DRAFT_616817 [Peziza echinospora]|nr:hypothetical protein DFH27DRAFT_616817 [Peziza echinospora]
MPLSPGLLNATEIDHPTYAVAGFPITRAEMWESVSDEKKALKAQAEQLKHALNTKRAVAFVTTRPLEAKVAAKAKATKTAQISVVVPMGIKTPTPDAINKVMAVLNKYLQVVGIKHTALTVAITGIGAKSNVRTITIATTSVAEAARHLITKWIEEALQINSWTFEQVYFTPKEEPSVVLRTTSVRGKGGMENVAKLNPGVVFGPRYPSSLGPLVSRVYVGAQQDLVKAFSHGLHMEQGKRPMIVDPYTEPEGKKNWKLMGRGDTQRIESAKPDAKGYTTVDHPASDAEKKATGSETARIVFGATNAEDLDIHRETALKTIRRNPGPSTGPAGSKSNAPNPTTKTNTPPISGAKGHSCNNCGRKEHLEEECRHICRMASPLTGIYHEATKCKDCEDYYLDRASHSCKTLAARLNGETRSSDWDPASYEDEMKLTDCTKPCSIKATRLEDEERGVPGKKSQSINNPTTAERMEWKVLYCNVGRGVNNAHYCLEDSKACYDIVILGEKCRESKPMENGEPNNTQHNKGYCH